MYKYFIILLFSVILFFAGKYAIDLYSNVKIRSSLQDDYAEINKVNYGLFNIQLWKEKAMDVVENRIGEFKISKDAFNNLDKEIDRYLHKMYSDYVESGKMTESIYEQIEKSGKVNPMFMKLIKDNLGGIISNIDLESQIPGLTKQLSREIRKQEPQIRAYIQEGLMNMVMTDVETKLVDKRKHIYEKYDYDNAEQTIAYIDTKIADKNIVVDNLINYVMGLLGMGLLFLLLSWKIIKSRLVIVGFTMISVVLLILGVTLPMINIDARLNSFVMDLMGEQIEFGEQVLLYQSKSILEVVNTLWQGNGFDLKIVGAMIFMFSIVFPFIKLILSTLYMFINRVKENKIAQTIIFYVSKWSMADVFVVAMFMAFIGFDGLVTSQLGDIARNQTGYAVETLNYSKLTAGALFFTNYCILSIITSIMISRVDTTETITHQKS